MSTNNCTLVAIIPFRYKNLVAKTLYNGLVMDIVPNEPNRGENTYRMDDGSVEDIALLPTDLTLPEDDQNPASFIKFAPMQFDYDFLKDGMANRNTKLRLAKDELGQLQGFIAYTPGKESLIDMVWVAPESRKKGVGRMLMGDALLNLPDGPISLSIQGKAPMLKLAEQLGFTPNPSTDMGNKYTYTKTSPR